MDSPTLSTEEKEELVRSNKKVKCPTHEQGIGPDASSFRDKLVGDIPGAYSQAFFFMIAWRMKTDLMMRLKTFVKV